MPAAVIIAAGEGRRAGGYKPLWPLGGKTVIDWSIDAASRVCDPIRVVGGFSIDDLRGHLSSRQPHVILVDNPGWREGGMFSSIQFGLQGVSGAAFIHPADIPGASGDVYVALAEAITSRDEDVLRPLHGDRTGHPVLLSPGAVKRVLQASSDCTLRNVLGPMSKADIPVSDSLIHFDFDTGEDFERLSGILETR